ncbi:MAG: hypothetical protein AB1393_11410 [Candidatus Edwardsbacteria bacterium]
MKILHVGATWQVALVLLFLLVGCSKKKNPVDSSSGSGSVYGKAVLQNETNSSGIEVFLSGKYFYSTTTDSTGSYRFYGVKPDTYKAMAMKAGYYLNAVTKNIIVEAGRVTSVSDIILGDSIPKVILTSVQSDSPSTDIEIYFNALMDTNSVESAFSISCPSYLQVFYTLGVIPERDGILLHWATVGEINTSRWNIERSFFADSNYTLLVTIPSQGTSPDTFEYRWTDQNIVHDVIYFYRLGQVDISGNTTYYGPVSAMHSIWKNKGSLLKFRATFLPQTSYTVVITSSAKDITGKNLKPYSYVVSGP